MYMYIQAEPMPESKMVRPSESLTTLPDGSGRLAPGDGRFISWKQPLDIFQCVRKNLFQTINYYPE